MAARARSPIVPVAVTPGVAFLKAQKALDQAVRLQRSGDLAGSIRSCQEGIASVADAEDTEGIQLRVRLRVQKETVSRMRRDASRAG